MSTPKPASVVKDWAKVVGNTAPAPAPAAVIDKGRSSRVALPQGSSIPTSTIPTASAPVMVPPTTLNPKLSYASASTSNRSRAPIGKPQHASETRIVEEQEVDFAKHPLCVKRPDNIKLLVQLSHKILMSFNSILLQIPYGSDTSSLHPHSRSNPKSTVKRLY